MSYDSNNLTTPDIKWLGVRPSDLDRFNVPEQCRLPMTDEDVKLGKRMVRLYALSCWQRPLRATGCFREFCRARACDTHLCRWRRNG